MTAPTPYDEADGMCPNCVTPWKCNGPHEPGAAPTPGKALTCHRCGSTDLVLGETTHEHRQWADGLLLVDGEIRPKGTAHHWPGLIESKTRIDCDGCGHSWTPRRRVGEPADWSS